MTTDTDRAARHNAELAEKMAAAKATRGYLITYGGATGTVHAAVGIMRGHSGYNHPRSLCQPSTSMHYHAARLTQDAPVTCKRCLASMAKRGIA